MAFARSDNAATAAICTATTAFAFGAFNPMFQPAELARSAGAAAAVAFAVSGVRKCPKVVALGASNKINDFHRPSFGAVISELWPDTRRSGFF